MQIINELLKDTPQDVRNSYKSYLRLHLKQIMTTINKNRLQDTTQTQMRKNKCILNCYEKATNVINSTDSNNLNTKNQSNSRQAQYQQLIMTVQQLKDCKKSCKQQQHAVKKHIDDVNFYSKRKFAGCSQKCQNIYQNANKQQMTKSGGVGLSKQFCKPYSDCLWECYNRLDRRYKDYWKKQQDDIIKGYL